MTVPNLSGLDQVLVLAGAVVASYVVGHGHGATRVRRRIRRSEIARAAIERRRRREIAAKGVATRKSKVAKARQDMERAQTKPRPPRR